MEMKSEEEQDASQSALFYLFQEVSKIAFTAHNSFPDTDPPSKWLDGVSRKDPVTVKKEEKEAHLCETSNSACQQLSQTFPCKLVKGANRESQSNKHQTSVEVQCETTSPWKVLSLINLHCERLLLQKEEESDPRSASSTAKLDSTALLSSTVPDVAEVGARNDGMRDDYTVGTPLLPSEMQQIPAIGVEGLTDDCTGHGDEDCGQPQTAEEMHGVGAELEESVSPLQPPHEPKRETTFTAEQLPSDVSFSEHTLSQVSVTGPCSHIQPTFNSGDDAPAAPCKPSVTLDHNANIVSSWLPSDALLSPASSATPPSQPAASHFTTAQSYHTLSSQRDQTAESTADCTLVPTEEQSAPAAQQKELVSLASPLSQPEISTEQQEELGFPSNSEWKSKKPRKQAHPCRSADSDDPDFQGVTFRMDTELDDSKEQCRLLITSKYSKLCKTARKRRRRTQTPQKPLRTSSSEEENDPTANVLKDKACASCCTRKTPMWRDAEDGTPLCNACGIRYKKYRVRCVNCWHIPRKEGNSNSSCLKCGNFVRLTSAQRKHTT